MKFRSKISAFAAVVGAVTAAMVPSGQARATTYTTQAGTPSTMTVTASANASCTVTTTPVVFSFSGTALGSSDATAQGSVTSNCTSGVPYGIAANGGAAGTISQRTLTSGSNSLNYNLYIDASMTQLWGDGTTGTQINLTGTGANQTSSIYGKIPNSNAIGAPAGYYTDSVTVTAYY